MHFPQQEDGLFKLAFPTLVKDNIAPRLSPSPDIPSPLTPQICKKASDVITEKET